MAEKKQWDLTSTHSLQGATEWIRKRSGALFVLVVRGEDVAFAIDDAIRAQDATDMILAAMPEVVESLTRVRAEHARKSKGER